MATYQKKLKENIKQLINENRLKDAKDLLNQYEDIVKNDVDIYTIRGVIAIMEGNMDEAEEVLGKGVLEDNDDDLLYNIAYLYKVIGKIDRAIYFYKRLYHQTSDTNTKKEVEKELDNLKANTKIRILIGSPIHQKPNILKEFLLSLKSLNQEDMEVYYYFIDDNIDKESSKMLSEFAMGDDKTIIKKSGYSDQYIRNEETHIWKEDLIWKVANFKNHIIQYARKNDFDCLFFVDSDLILHPNTLQQLISTGKDIVSEIFWTKWNQGDIELPQVWMYDTYIQYQVFRGEQLSKHEAYERHMDFLNRLRNTGIYEVGGLGACTLISKYALDKGVNFKEITNLSFVGEDRHFCIRATALGFKLYVDTHYPAYHIYRQTDLAGVDRYKQDI